MANPKSGIGRRAILFGAPPLLAAGALAGCGKRAPIAEEQDPPPTFFTGPEWAFMKAAVDRLIPDDGPGPGGLFCNVHHFIDRQMELPYGYGAYWYMQAPFQPDAPAELGYQLRYSPRELYRLGIAATDNACRELHGQLFAGLAPDLQDRVLTALQTGTMALKPVPAKTFFGQLLGNAKEGYLSDPIHGGNRFSEAWRWIGFPGARADFTAFIDSPGKPYPYPPVSIAGSSAS